MAGDGLEEPPVEPGMNVKIKLNEENEITHIILDDHHKFQQIEAIEVKKCDFKDDLFIEGITAYDNERHHFKIARKSFFVENGSLVQIARETDSLHIKAMAEIFNIICRTVI